jgi:hypothetical protein
MFSYKDINDLIVHDVLNIDFVNIIYIYRYLLVKVLYDIFYNNIIFVKVFIYIHEYNLKLHVFKNFHLSINFD